MSPYNYPRKVFIGRFDCDNCGTIYTGVEFTVDTMEIYCKVCDSKESLPLRDIKLKIPIEYRNNNNKKVGKDGRRDL